MFTTYTLADLEVLFEGRDKLEAVLEPFHELRPDGIWVSNDARLKSWREAFGVGEPVPMDHLLIVGQQSVNTPVLPAVFSERDLARFLSVRSVIALSLQNRFCNDKPGVPKWIAGQKAGERIRNPEYDAPPFPFDEEALAQLSEQDAGVAAGLIRAALVLLWKGEVSAGGSRQNAATKRGNREGWFDLVGEAVIEVQRSGRYETAKRLYQALEQKAQEGDPSSPLRYSSRQLRIAKNDKHLSLKTVQNWWGRIREAARRE